MRILCLTLLLTLPYFYFRDSETVEAPETIDAIKLKMASPSRSKRTLSPRPIVPEKRIVETPRGEEDLIEEGRAPAISSAEGDMEHFEEKQWSDLEEDWNIELRTFLNRMEPVDGDSIHRAYLEEQESYRAQVDALLNDRHQKTSDESVQETENLMSELDQKHQDRLKQILGAHFEAIQDYYEDFMEASSDR